MIVSRSHAQGLVELTLVLPGLLLLVLIAMGLGIVTRVDGSVAAVAMEAARAGALASDPTLAADAAQARALVVGEGFGLTNGSLRISVNTSDFGRGGTVGVVATYMLHMGGLPLVGWAEVPLRHQAAEPVAPNRSFR